MGAKKRFEFVTRNTEEILTEKELKELLKKKKKNSAYYGTAPTGPFHMAYLIPLSKVFDFGKAGIKTKILVADIHAALDDLKTPWEEIDRRASYYKKCIELAFPWEEKPKFVKGKDFQLKKDYHLDLLKLSTLTTVNRAKRAASEVTRMKSAKVSELIYPVMQALDEEYLKVDMQLGGIDQRHIMAYAREVLPKIGYKPRIEIMTPLIASLKGPGTKMSASVPGSFIKVYDSEKSIKKKINEAYCPVRKTEENPVLQLTRFVLFPVLKKVKVERPKKYGGDISFKSYEELEKKYVQGDLHPSDLKNTVARELTRIFKKARKYFEKHKHDLKDLGKEFKAD